VETEAGGVGYGEAAPIPWFGMAESAEAEQWLRSLDGVLRLEDLAHVPAELACVKSAFLAAVEGAAGYSGTPRAHVQMAALLPAGRAALDKAREHVDLGFRCLKWKVGVGDPADELAILDDLCGVLPEGARLRLDANGAWDRRRAERWLERCADRPVEFVEQPVAADQRGAEDLLLGLAQDFPTPLALDESVVSDADLELWLGLGWPGLYVLKTSLLGDPRARLERLAREKAGVVFSSALETRIGARRLLRLALEWPGEARAVGAGVWPLFEDARFDGPFAAPFFRLSELSTLNEEQTWNALS
jgi:O-succinylbenzoate synthase